MTDPKDIAIRELAKQVAHLLGSEARDYEQREAIAELKRERDELLQENEKYMRVFKELNNLDTAGMSYDYVISIIRAFAPEAFGGKPCSE